jgi:hypothetical protein
VVETSVPHGCANVDGVAKEHDLRLRRQFMGGVDDLLHKVCQRWVAQNASSNEHALARLRPQLISESLEAAFGRGVENFVDVAGSSHLLLQVGEPFGELWAVFCGDGRMIQGQTDMDDGYGHLCVSGDLR